MTTLYSPRVKVPRCHFQERLARQQKDRRLRYALCLIAAAALSLSILTIIMARAKGFL